MESAQENSPSNESQEVILEVQPRDVGGSEVAKRLRREGLLPAVAYSAGKPAHRLIISEREFVKMATSSLPSQVVTFKSNASELNDRKVIVKDIQVSPIKGEPLHVDFQILEDGKKVAIKVPLEFTGEPEGVRIQGGIFTAAARDIRLFCVGDSIPRDITINVTALKLGERIRAKDIELPQGVTLAGSPDETLASVVAGRAARTAAAAEKDGEGAEGESGEGDGAAAADGAGDSGN